MELDEIAIIDADFIGRKNHRFPNLTCMKISAYYKLYGWLVKLKTDYDGLERFHKVYIAKVFSFAPIPDGGLFGDILKRPNVIYGGTGFFFDKAEPLPDRLTLNEIAHAWAFLNQMLFKAGECVVWHWHSKHGRPNFNERR